MQLPLIKIFAGLLLLFLGRRLFWLFVGILGFFAGFALAERLFPGQSGMILLIIAVGCGLIGIFVALFLQHLAIAIAGFLAGGLFASTFLQSAGWHVAPYFPFIIGGIIGAILLSLVFDWALILLSSITGATFIMESLPIEPQYRVAAFVVLLILGIFVQARFHPPATVSKRTSNVTG
jgi:MFS family permease